MLAAINQTGQRLVVSRSSLKLSTLGLAINQLTRSLTHLKMGPAAVSLEAANQLRQTSCRSVSVVSCRCSSSSDGSHHKRERCSVMIGSLCSLRSEPAAVLNAAEKNSKKVSDLLFKLHAHSNAMAAFTQDPSREDS